MPQSADKGRRGERELCRKLRGLGFGATRSAQVAGFKNYDESADIITSIDPVRFEVKRGYEDVSITSQQFEEWIEKAKKETPTEDGVHPVLAWRKNRQPWVFFHAGGNAGLHLLRGAEEFNEYLQQLLGAQAVEDYMVSEPGSWKTTDKFC